MSQVDDEQLRHRVTLRVALENVPGMLGRVTRLVEESGGEVCSVDAVAAHRHMVVRELAVLVADDAHTGRIAVAIDEAEGAELLAITDDVVAAHLGGKITIVNTRPVRDNNELALVYTPGVGRISQMIAEDPTEAYRLTIKAHSVAIVTDGSAVLGLGDIGPLAALPVMEGKAMLFKEFGNVDAYPILVDERDPQRIVETVARIALGFGGINLEDIAAPRCFEIERELRARLDIPVFHDDQHGTAVVVVAALLSSARLLGRDLGDLKVVVQGMGAAGTACTELLLGAGVKDIVGVDRLGILTTANAPDDARVQIAKMTNPRQLEGDLAVALTDADVLIGVSAPATITVEHLELMAPERVLFALANPVPEIMPEVAAPHVTIMATGRSDYPNQINNVLCFPGLFRGLLDAAATEVSTEMELAAAHAIAEIVGADAARDYIVPSPFDHSVAPAVARAVSDTARQLGLVRPGSYGSLQDERDARAYESARRALARAAERLGPQPQHAPQPGS